MLTCKEGMHHAQGAFIRRHTSISASIKGIKREEIPQYSPMSLTRCLMRMCQQYVEIMRQTHWLATVIDMPKLLKQKDLLCNRFEDGFQV